MSKAATRRTFGAAIGRWRLPEVTAFFALALLWLAPAPASADDGHRLRFMIQNLYAGSFFQEINAARTPSEIIAAATLTYQHILATRPAERAVVIADKIAKLRPDFVSLHQAAILRTGALNAPPATAVTFDLLQSLLAELAELAARGVPYKAVAVKPGLDAETPTALGFNIRLALRDVLIVRADLLEEDDVKLSNLQIRQYIAASNDTEGYSSFDVTWRGRQFRLVTTHFALLSFAVPQALELVRTAADTTLPVVLVADCNCNPDNPTDPIFQNYPAYLLLKNAGFVDVFRTARPNDPGFTCCHDENLLNVTSTLMSHRIDLVQFRGPFMIEDVQVVNASPADHTRLGLWPSDHAGVVATLTLRSGDDAD